MKKTRFQRRSRQRQQHARRLGQGAHVPVPQVTRWPVPQVKPEGVRNVREVVSFG